MFVQFGTITENYGVINAGRMTMEFGSVINVSGLFTMNTSLYQAGAINCNSGALAVFGSYNMIAGGSLNTSVGCFFGYNGTTDMSVSGQINENGGGISTFGAGLSLVGTYTVTSGSFNGNLNNSGTLQFAGGLQTFNITGNYNQFSTGTLSIRVGPNGTSDTLAVSGTASMDGILTVTALGIPTANAVYTVITASAITGAFKTVNVPPPLNGATAIVPAAGSGSILTLT